jgi:hypothetical protein
MAPKWIVEVPADQVQDDTDYFIGRRPRTEMAGWLFVAENRAGKQMMSEKPGIAMRFVGGEKMRAHLRGRPDLAAIAIPADADKRWRARRCVSPRNRTTQGTPP